MQHILKSKKVVFIAITVAGALLILLYLIFFPFIHIKYAVYQNKPGTTDSYVSLTKFDFFKPKLSQIKKLGDGTYYVGVSDFERDGIFFLKDTGYNDGMKKPIDEDAVDARISNKSLEEVLKLTTENDLSKVNPDAKNIDGVGKIIGNSKNEFITETLEASNPENEYYDLLKINVLKDPNRYPFYKENRQVSMFKEVRVGDLFLDFQNKVEGGEEINSSGKATGLDEAIFLFNNANINFIAFGFDDLGVPGKDEKYKTAKLQKIVIVKQDRSFIEVPTKADGTFDFDGVLKEIQ